jgi:AsmA protein
MSKPVKYFLIIAASFVVLVVAAAVTVTALVDVERFKPKIEQLVTEKTGYPLTLGGEISLSFFPWIGLSFTDLQLDNPEGFADKLFVRIDSFEARLKVLPLLSRNVEISSFVVNQPEIFLEKRADGVWNWQKLAERQVSPKIVDQEKAAVPESDENTTGMAGKSEEQTGFTLQSLNVGECRITEGRVQINDLQTKQRHEVADFALQLDDVSFDKPVKLAMQAMFDGKPLSLDGTVGPFGPDPGAGKINVDLAFKIIDALNVRASGYVADITTQKTFNLALEVKPFSLKKVYSTLGLSFPLITSDPKVFDKVAVEATVVGDPDQIAVSDADIVLDDSTVRLDLRVKEFSRPNLTFALAVDSLDLDRYLPPGAAESTPTPGPGKTEVKPEPPLPGKISSKQAEKKKTDKYASLRKLVLNGTVKVAQLKIHGGTVSNIAVNVAGREGLLEISSLAMQLYGGNVAGTGKLNVQENTPVSTLKIALENVQVAPMLQDFAQKNIIEGTLKAEVALNLKGDNGELIKQSLSGQGDLLFQDGALIGLDLAQMARTIKSGFTLEQQGERPKTDFAELHAPFSITRGLVTTPATTLRSPFLRVALTGDANLVSEALDMEMKPTIVGTIKGQGDEKKRSGLTIPVLIGGTFKAPQFRPDLEALVKDKMPSEEDLSEIIKTGKIPPELKDQYKEEVEQAKGLLKGLFGK